MTEKVAPIDRTKDTHLKNLLAKQGINKDYVELFQDYATRNGAKQRTPYARFYKDRISGRRVMVVGILPHVTNAGFFILPKFRTLGNKFIAEENCFECEIDGKQVRLVCASDQPTGYRKFDTVIYRPRLYFNNMEQTCGKASWLEADPTNPHYHQNVLEWDYGVCKRRVRIIEGRFSERWITSYRGKIEVAHNSSGNLPLRMGQCHRADGTPVIVQVIGDREIVDTTNFPDNAFPIVMSATLTVYPDPHDEVSSVDGAVYAYDAGGLSWADILAHGGTGVDDTLALDRIFRFRANGNANEWDINQRGIFLFDTSGLPDVCTISGVIFSLYGESKEDGNSATPDANVYSTAPASNVALVGTDYASFGTEALSTTVTYANFVIGSYGNFALIDVNSDGFATYNVADTYINKTGVTKLGIRNVNYDISGTPPNWVSGQSSGLQGYYADQGNTTSDPKLVVTYTVPTPAPDGDLIGIAIIRKS